MNKVYKLTIVDNTIANCYQYSVYEWKFKNWWALQKSWNLVERHSIGKKYICPDIYKKIKTVEDIFNEDVEYVKNRYIFNEIHNTIITQK